LWRWFLETTRYDWEQFITLVIWLPGSDAFIRRLEKEFMDAFKRVELSPDDGFGWNFDSGIAAFHHGI
jgi:hypothetical protein